MKIPIFVIVHNQYEMLKKSLYSYESQIDYPIEIVLHNANSKYQPTLDFLKEREGKGDKVYHSNNSCGLPNPNRWKHFEPSNGNIVVDTIRSYLSANPKCKYIILTDPDVELYNVRSNLIETYIYLLNKYDVYGVGPALKLDDIPDHYPKKQVAQRWERKFNGDPRIQEEFDNVKFELKRAPIDTTFHLVRANDFILNFPQGKKTLNMHGNCVRVFEPYNARHLDWYIDPNNMTDCEKYYAENASDISHWNNPRFKGWKMKVRKKTRKTKP